MVGGIVFATGHHWSRSADGSCVKKLGCGWNDDLLLEVLVGKTT
jgi:hypothetical protein